VPADRDNESGQFCEQYPTEKFFKAIQDLEVATTTNVAEEVGCSYDLAYRRLNSLAEEGSVTKTDVGGSFIWTAEQDTE
jgi:hypothetical protein